MSASPPTITALGDSAVTVAFAHEMDTDAMRRARRFADLLRARRLGPVIEIVPAYVTVTIHYDPFEIDFASFRDQLRACTESAAAPSIEKPARAVVIPVRYDGPDLGEVAERTGLSRDDVIERHAGQLYEVALLGFVPGFAYMMDLDPALALPRRATPRTVVPPGSVAIAGRQTGIYPAATPGGWHLLGTTDLRMFDPARDPAALLAVGDRVRFEPVGQ